VTALLLDDVVLDRLAEALVERITGTAGDVLADRVAARVADLLAADVPQPAPALVDAVTVAKALDLTAQTVRRHAEALGGRRVGRGPWRFHLETALAAGSCYASRTPTADRANNGGDRAPVRRRRKGIRPRGMPPAGSVLAIRGPGAES
jgi:hypothetical protein